MILIVIGIAVTAVWLQGAPGAAIYVVTLLCLAALSVLARNHPWPGPGRHHAPPAAPERLHLWAIPGCADCALADPPPCNEHGARELAGIPRYYPERVVYRSGWPPELADIEKRLTGEDSLATDPANEGTTQ